MERAGRSRRTSLAFVLVAMAMGCHSGGSGRTAPDAAIDRAPEVAQDLAQEPTAEAPDAATPDLRVLEDAADQVDSPPPVVDAAVDALVVDLAMDLAIDVAAEAGGDAAAPVDSAPASPVKPGHAWP